MGERSQHWQTGISTHTNFVSTSDTENLVMKVELPITQTLPMSFGTMLIQPHLKTTGYQGIQVPCIMQTQNDISRNKKSEVRSMEKEILRLINNNNGELSWYQLDRALSYQQKHVHTIHRLVDVLKELERKGLIRSEGEGPQPIYWITDVGRKLVEEQEAHIR
jgi:uncharacterized membrane protein